MDFNTVNELPDEAFDAFDIFAAKCDATLHLLARFQAQRGATTTLPTTPTTKRNADVAIPLQPTVARSVIATENSA